MSRSMTGYGSRRLALVPSARWSRTSRRARTCTGTTPSVTRRCVGDAPLADQKMLKEATPAAIASLMRFLDDAHARLRRQVDALANDSELVRRRRTNWGDTAETRWIIKAT